MCLLIILITRYEDIKTFLNKNVFYTKKYENIVQAHSSTYSVDENLIYAIIQNESNFFPFAKSKADARGLMQITPITWQHAEQTLGFNNSDFYDKNLNIKVGTWYLSYLKNIYKDEKLAIMAYNCGIENVNNWLEKGFLQGDDISKWNIPFLETRYYLENVVKSKEEFSKLDKEVDTIEIYSNS